MADITVDVNLPSTISVDVTSPTQVLATNISIPGPQGPTGPRGFTPLINGITGESILFSGKDGIITSTDQSINTIYISGNSGYFQSAVNSLTTNLNSTGANLNTSINNLSGLFTEYTGTLDTTYATDSQLNSTGSNLENKITSLSGILTGNYLTTNVASSTYATISNLNSTGSTLNSSISSLSGTLTSNYATIINLASTGSNLQNQINNLDNVYATDASVIAVANNLASTGSTLETKIGLLSGTLTSNYATITNLASTGSTLNNNINSLSGTLTSNYATITNLASTGSTLVSSINSLNSAFTGFTGNLDATYATDTQLTSTGSTLVSSINSLSGYINSTSSNIIFTTGNQIKSGRLIIGDDAGSIVDPNSEYTLSLQTNSPRTWLEILNHSGTNKGVFFGIEGNDFEQYNWQAGDIKFFTSENFSDGTERLRIKNDGKVGIGTSSPSEKLEVVGNILANNLVYNTGNQTISGNKTFDLAPILSGNPLITGNLSLYATAINLASTGSTLNTRINDLSGYVNNQNTSISNNLSSTGNTLQNSINSLSGSSVLLYGNQSIGGIKTFRDNVYINNLFVTGTETIVSTNNFNVQSPYLILNLTGGAVDGGIFFVTGSGLTGVNDTGPIIGFDHVNKFKFGISTRNSDLSTLPDIASVQDIQAYSGFVDGKYATIINLVSTGFTLDTKINNLSGYSNNTFATITNLVSTGNTLASNLASTGSTLQTNINTVSSNLASTGLTLNTKIDNLSGYVNSTGSNIVFTTGNQNITGIKIFTSPLIISGADLSGINTNGTQGFRLTSRALGLLGDSLQTVLVNEGYGGITQLGTDGNTTLRIQRGDNSSAVLPNNTSLGWYKPSPSNVGEVPDVRLWRDGSGILSLRSDNISRGANFYITPSGMQFRVFNITGTNTGEFALLGWQNNELVIGAQATNSGILRSLIITGDSISYSGKRLTIAHGNAGLFFDAVSGPTIRGNHWGAGDAGFVTYRNGIDIGRGGSKYLRVDSTAPTVIVGNAGATSSLAGIGFDGTNSNLDLPDAFIIRDASGVLSLRNPRTNLGNSPQQLRIFNITGTNTGEFGLFGWQNSQLILGSQQSQSGTLRDVVITGNNININGAGTFNVFDNTNIVGNLNVTGNILLSGNQVLTGSSTLYATSVNLAQTGSTLDTKINNLSGVSVLTFGNQNIGGNKTFTGITTFSGQEINLVDTALNLSGVGDMTFSGTNINFINSPVYISGTNLRVSGDVSAYNVYTTGKIGVGTSSPTEKLEVNGNIKFGDSINGYSAKFIMWDPANAVYNTGDWYDSQLTLTDSANNKSIALNFYGDTNSLISNGSILRLPSGKDDFIAMDSEVVHKTGNETISGIKTFIGNHIISGNTTVSGSINISGNYDIYSQIENVKKLAIAYAIAL